MYRRAIVVEVDASTHRVRVRFPDRDDVTLWLDVLTRGTHGERDYGLYSVGSQVAVVLDEHEETGAVLGAVYSSVDRPTVTNADTRRFEFGDGGLVEYDRGAHVLRVTVPSGGRLELAGSSDAVALASEVLAQLTAIAAATHTHPAGALASPAGAVTGITGAASIGYSAESVASTKVVTGG